MKVHLFDFKYYNTFPKWHKDKFNATRCGYTRNKVTTDISKVTCKLCLKQIEKENINE